MICPACRKPVASRPANRASVSADREHLWGICPHCREMMHFVWRPAENRLYGWAGNREAAYAGELAVLQNRRHVLYVPEAPGGVSPVELCRKFGDVHGWRVGFAISFRFREAAAILRSAHTVAVMPEVLFPELPSFLAEKLLLETVPGRLYSTSGTLSDRFEVWP